MRPTGTLAAALRRDLEMLLAPYRQAEHYTRGWSTR
jgi:hypothetical protein